MTGPLGLVFEISGLQNVGQARKSEEIEFMGVAVGATDPLGTM